MARIALTWLAGADVAALTCDEQAECLRELEQIEAATLAARSAVLARFDAARGFENDGHGSARTWLTWQTRITGRAAAGAVGWMRRLAAHPAVRDSLASGSVSASWARVLCDWTDRLPEAARADADLILLAAAAAGAELADLAGLAEEMHRRTAHPDDDGDDGFGDRSVRLSIHYQGAGRLDGDLTPRCAAALQAVLDALGKKAGLEDMRTKAQRDHDALEEACRRLIGAGYLPDRAGQSTQIQLHMTLDQLTGLAAEPSTEPGTGPGTGTTPWLKRNDQDEFGQAGSSPDEGPWAHGNGRGWLPAGPQAGSGDYCDASIVPVVTGHIDPEPLDRLADGIARSQPANDKQCDGEAIAASPASSGQAGRLGDEARDPSARSERLSQAFAREMTVRDAVTLLSGPSGLAAWLRTNALTGPAASISLPLDIGTATDTIPQHLRRAVIHRDRHCRFAGCDRPPAACQVHHLVPRAHGGATKITNLVLLCSFHHLTVVHTWGWQFILNADGTTTAISPDRKRILHSHDPPATAA
jgi:hypothetical protein